MYVQKPGEPIRVKMSFETVATFDWDAFINDAAKVDTFKTTVKALLAAGIAARIPTANGVTSDAITVENLAKGSIEADVTIDTTSITDAATMDTLVGMIMSDPVNLLNANGTTWAKFLADYGLTGTVTAEQIKLTAAAPSNMPVIVGAVVGGVGGALLIAAIAVFLVKRR